MDLRRLPALGAALAASACAAADPGPWTQTEPGLDTARWRTFVWARPAPADGPDPETYQRAEAAVGRALAARGYAEGEPAQFAVALSFGAPDAVKLFTHGPAYSVAPDPRAGWRSWGGPLDVPRPRAPTEGQLTLDVFDVATRKPVWRATSQVHLGRDAAAADLEAVAAELLAELPPAGG